MRQLHFDLLRLLEDDRQGSHGSRRARRYVLAQAAETLHRLGYRGLRAKGLKGRHIGALVAEWQRQGLSDGTIKNRMAPPSLAGEEDRQAGDRAQGQRELRGWRAVRDLNFDLLQLQRRPAATARTPRAGTAPTCWRGPRTPCTSSASEVCGRRV